MYICIEYLCDAGHRFDSLETRGQVPDGKRCECGEMAEKVISAPSIKTPVFSVTQGTNQERPPGVPDTSVLADRKTTYSKWRDQDRGKRMDEHRRHFGITPKVFV